MSEDSFDLFITCAKSQEDLLAFELQELGIEAISTSVGGIGAQTNLKQALSICLWSRIANRVLLKLNQFSIADDNDLYNQLMDYPWHQLMDVRDTFAVSCTLHRTEFTHSKFLALRTKDAIVDYFRDREDERPSVDTNQPDIQINLYVSGNEANLYLDLSGDSLHKRGYRVTGERAPLKENLAAAILYRCKWHERAKRQESLVDPMCGSGTLLIEAAYMASNTAPGLYRDYYGFKAWQKFDLATWNELLEEAKEKQDFSLLPPITGYDIDKHAIYASKNNLKAAGLEDYIHIEKRDICEASPRKPEDNGLVVVNPPYGERLGEIEEITALYQIMGEQFKAQFQGWDAFVFTFSTDLGKAIPLRAYKTNSLYNGPMQCKLLHFHIDPKWYFEKSDGFRYIAPDARDESSKMLENRINKNLRHLQKWAKREKVYCYRLYDADIPEYSLAIDLYYSDTLLINVQEYEAPKTIPEKLAKKRLNDGLSIIKDIFNVDKEQIFLKTRKQQKGLSQYEKKQENADFQVIEEYGLNFYVSFKSYLDTGLFLDHRKTRQLIFDLAENKDVLNLFCYTGSVSVYAAAGGAKSVTSVDMSKPYLLWAKRNLSLNKFEGNQYEFIQDDCVKWLKECEKSYDLIFLDPPSFSNSKRMESHFSVERDHEDLIDNAMKVLNKNGTLIFSNNFRKFKMSEAVKKKYNVENISASTLPEDFKRNPKIHNCWKITNPT